jgi:hypothetical protein
MSPAAPALPRKKLPVGIQNLREIREQGHYYVDKSGLAIDLLSSGKYFFLSRPRRFGKSLLVDTFKELFEGNRALFEGLAAETRWDWSRRHPVIRISFSDGMLQSRTELDTRIHEILQDNEIELGVQAQRRTVNGRFAELIRLVHERHGAPAVVLVDEYDKPILDNITDPARAAEMRDGLRNLYSVLKGADPHLKFVFLTGVSKFSKVSLFSGLNNLQDITLDARWSALCGYTDHDIDTVFAPELPGLDRDEIRRWYNGYNWRGVGIYNPFDVLLLFDTREFKAHWFDTGTPTFLVKLLADQSWFTPDLAQLKADEMELLSFEVEQIGAVALLFQAGYLSVHAVEETETRELIYTLGYPNREVEMSLNRVLLPGYGVPGRAASLNRQTLLKALRERDWSAMETTLRALFASIPSDWYRKNPLAGFEGHYASVFYSHLAGLGLDLRVEDATNQGRIDLTLVQQEQVFLFEFKVVADEPEGHALRQIRDKGYAEKYLGRGANVHLIGVEFSRTARNIVGFEVETLAV